ncbi:hypothetical protein R6Z07F_003780 [Ovis aries]
MGAEEEEDEDEDDDEERRMAALVTGTGVPPLRAQPGPRCSRWGQPAATRGTRTRIAFGQSVAKPLSSGPRSPAGFRFAPVKHRTRSPELRGPRRRSAVAAHPAVRWTSKHADPDPAWGSSSPPALGSPGSLGIRKTGARGGVAFQNPGSGLLHRWVSRPRPAPRTHRLGRSPSLWLSRGRGAGGGSGGGGWDGGERWNAPPGHLQRPGSRAGSRRAGEETPLPQSCPAPWPSPQPVPSLPGRCQENLCPGRAGWHLKACLTGPSQQQELGREVTLCQRRQLQQCHPPPGPRGPQDRCSAPQGIFLTQGWHRHLLHSLLLSHQGSPECEHPRNRDRTSVSPVPRILPAYDLYSARSGAGAGDRGEEDDARETPGSDRGGMALPGQGDQPRSPHPFSGLALRSSVWARQRAPGGGAAEGPGAREPGKGPWRCRPVRTQLGSEGRTDGQAVRIQGR